VAPRGAKVVHAGCSTLGVPRISRAAAGPKVPGSIKWKDNTRIQGALKNLGHGVARSTVAKVLKANGILPAPDRPSSWRTFLRAHWGAIAGADFFTSEVWTPRGLITYYTLFVLDLRSRRVHVADSTPTPDAWFMAQAARRLTDAVDGFLASHQILLCDRDGKWTDDFRRIVQGAGVRIVLIPVRAPNANAYAERFVRSIREECLDRLILFGERRLLRAVDEFVAHYHKERNHQGLGNALIVPEVDPSCGPRVRCRERLGGLLRYYHRAA
jgi:transposase InsO family protein